MTEGASERVRHPRFDGYVCIVNGCRRVEYKHGLCRGHWGEIPLADRLQVMLDAIHASLEAAKRGDAMAAEWASRYSAGMINHPGPR